MISVEFLCVCVKGEGTFSSGINMVCVLNKTALRGLRGPWKWNSPKMVDIEFLESATFVLTACPFWNVDNSLLTHKDILLQPRHLWPSLTVGENLESKVGNWLIISPNSFCAKSFFGQDVGVHLWTLPFHGVHYVFSDFKLFSN